jgi:hypothetical protein
VNVKRIKGEPKNNCVNVPETELCGAFRYRKSRGRRELASSGVPTGGAAPSGKAFSPQGIQRSHRQVDENFAPLTNAPVAAFPQGHAC